MIKIPLSGSYHLGPRPASTRAHLGDMLRKYLRGEPIYISFEGNERREGSIAKLTITNVQDLLHGNFSGFTSWNTRNRTVIAETPENVRDDVMGRISVQGVAHWDKRANRVKVFGSEVAWLKDHDPQLGTNWVYKAKAIPPKVAAHDKLGREIKVGDFISYILYHFDNSRNAAGIYYGKVTKVEDDGAVWAKNIQLAENDKTAEKKIKDNSLVVIMTTDLMDQLMIARLASL